jgi:hypothetical protein
MLISRLNNKKIILAASATRGEGISLYCTSSLLRLSRREKEEESEEIAWLMFDEHFQSSLHFFLIL